MSEPILLRQDEIVRVGVVCLVRDGKGNILMHRRIGSHGASTWSIPGGWMDFGEEPHEAVAREVLEEIGIEVIGIKDRGYWTSDCFDSEGKHSLTLWFSAFMKDDGNYPTIMEPDKISHVIWVPALGPYPEPLFLPLETRIKQVGSLW